MIEKALLISDVHIPCHDKELTELVVFKFGKHLKPDTIFLNGDIIDNYSISHYSKHPESGITLIREINETKKFLIRLRLEFPKSKIIYVFGNHEHRMEAYILEHCPALFTYVNLEDLLGLKEINIDCVRSSHKENWIKHKNLYVGHYDSAKSTAGATAQHLIKDKGVSLIQGHIHRVGMTAKRYLDRTDYAYENPCLADMEVDYVKDPNWQQGASVLYFNETEHWWYPIVAKDKQFIFEGKLWK